MRLGLILWYVLEKGLQKNAVPGQNRFGCHHRHEVAEADEVSEIRADWRKGYLG